mmetsp:Transcript_4233/g.15206  ORF Transcript_4233/g.15206 Transcript_4233/m.15206 type:complete len:287 (-) Transcript_4233:940-1800(-)
MGKQRQYRKRKVTDESDEEGGDHDEEVRPLSVSTQLEATKLLQQRRVRNKGLDATSVAQGVGVAAAAGEEEEEEEEAEQDDEGLGGFQTRAEADEDAEEDPQMLKYVEQEIAKKLGKNRPGADTTGEEGDAVEGEERLYQTPAYLEERGFDKQEEDARDRWTMGMAEVSLGVEHKLANIVATEAEKNRVLARHGLTKPDDLQNRQGPDDKQIRRMLPASLGSDFRTHAKTYRQDIKWKARNKSNVPRGPPVGSGYGAHVPNVHVATDDIMMARFRKHEINRSRMKR